MTVSRPMPNVGQVYGLSAERSPHEGAAIDAIRAVVVEALMLPGMDKVLTYDEATDRLIEHLAERGWMIVEADSLIY